MNKNCYGKLHYCLAIILFFCFSTSSWAQGSYNSTTWKFSNPKQFGFTVADVDFVDNNNVIAVGADGGIAKSTNGGATWTYGVFTYTTPTGYPSKATFLDVHYITPTTAYAVGTSNVSSGSVYGGGVMAKTSDGGVTWTMVNNPLYANRRNINTVWFLNKDTGYIAGSWNTADSLPKLYFTKNGGATWDSMAAPIGGKTKMGYVNNPNVPALDMDINAKAKEIYRIEFLNDSIGYITGGSSSGSGNYFPPVINVNATTCLPLTTFASSSGGDASLVWKFSKGTLIDYSISKERLGFNGIYNTAPNCSYRYASNGLYTNSYRAIHIVNDSTLLTISSNNNIVIRINTGKNDSTANINFPGVYEKGKYTILNTSNPTPINNSNLSGPSIPAVNPAFAFSQPTQIRKASNGKLYSPVNSPVIGPANRIMTSLDTGKTWIIESAIPPGRNYSTFGTNAIDIAPGGKFLVAGQGGVVADSLPGGAWASTYSFVPASGAQIEFADCSNGMVVGGAGGITVTTDGGKTWIDKARLDFAASFYTIGGFAYPTPTKTYFAVSNGIVYSSVDKGTTLDPAYSNFNFQMRDVAAIGNDSVWAVGQAASTVPVASRKPGIFRSFDGGLNWTEYSNFTMGSTAQFLTEVEFPSKNIGYAAGSRDTIWKTTDAGVTWTKLPLPTPGVTPQITYNDMFALDDNTVFLVGSGFPRQVVFKTIDGGNTWTEITSNILALRPESNLTGVLFHDANNGYVAVGGGILKTTNGGTSWTLDYAPSVGFGGMGFSPRKVPAGITFQNRKLFAGVNGSVNILEYGNPVNIDVNSTETVTNATCTNLTGGSITVNASGGLAPYTYSVNGGAFQSSNVLAGLTQGPQTIVIKDAFCGTLTKTVTVGFTDNMTVAARTDTTLCAGASVQLDATAPAGSTYAWSPANGLSATNIKNPIATTNVNTPANTSITYTVTASLNGCVKTDDVIVSIKPGPIVNAGPDVSILANNETLLQGSSSTAAQSIAWTPTTSILYGGTTFQVKVKPATTTTYTMTVIATNGCRSTDDVIVTVIPNCADVKNAFTPNGDGMNDRWIVSSSTACYTKLSVAVYNRYGGQVYHNDNYNNDWNGEYKGKPVADGTYYYVVNFKLLDGRTMTLKGDVTILR